jgi:hypothetical protein
LSEQDNVTAEELNAVFEQIQETMTAAQIAAIQDLQLTREEMSALAEQYGVEMNAGPVGEISAEMQATMEAARASGQRPEGFGPGAGGGPGGFGPDGGGGIPPGAGGGQSAQSGRDTSGTRRAGGGFGTAFYEAVIKILEAKAGK